MVRILKFLKRACIRVLRRLNLLKAALNLRHLYFAIRYGIDRNFWLYERAALKEYDRSGDSPEVQFPWKGYQFLRQVSNNRKVECNPNSELQYTKFIEELEGINLRDRYAENKNVSGRPLLSVIIPCLNEGKVAIECLDSIYRGWPASLNIEIILVDDGSTEPLYDALEDLLRDCPTIELLRCKENRGFGESCNYGAAHSSGEYLFFLNNDTQLHPTCIDELFTVLAADAGVGVVGPKILMMSGELQESGCFFNEIGEATLIGFGGNAREARFNYTRDVEHVSAVALMISTELFNELGGFDPVYSPAYYEDADLSFRVRESGHKIKYVPKAEVAHHLSKTTGKMSPKKRFLVGRNKDIFAKRWRDCLKKAEVKSLAFYLPQFHAIRENDRWWGKGFTEWTNVGKARSNYRGHYQPKVPGELGYYDLSSNVAYSKQVELARKHGLSGFCFYYYNFSGKKILENPLERLLQQDSPNFPFCLCWANENWTRRWDGGASNILMAQTYSDESILEIAYDLVRFLRSPNYIKSDGLPLLLIYRVKDIPDPLKMFDEWRRIFRERGVGEVAIVSVESFELSRNPCDPASVGCDFSVEFPPHEMLSDVPAKVSERSKYWKGASHDYTALVENYMTREEPGFSRFRSVLVGWDNTPRYQERSLVLRGATPGAFQAWMEFAVRRTYEQNAPGERFVFINAWNEWAEGSYLEPDGRFGSSYLLALRNALSGKRNYRFSEE